MRTSLLSILLLAFIAVASAGLFEGTWDSKMIVSSLGKNSDSSDIAPLNLNITFTDGEDGLRGTVISERFEHTIVITLESNTTGTFGIETSAGDVEPLFSFDLATIENQFYAQGVYKSTGTYQLVLSNDRFTFNLYDTKENTLTFVSGVKFVAPEETSFFQRFGLQGLITIVFIGTQFLRAYTRANQGEEAPAEEGETAPTTENEAPSNGDSQSDKKND